jgi:hypothetical protein
MPVASNEILRGGGLIAETDAREFASRWFLSQMRRSRHLSGFC